MKKRYMSNRTFERRLSYGVIISAAVLAFLLGVRATQFSPDFAKWMFPSSVWAADRALPNPPDICNEGVVMVRAVHKGHNVITPLLNPMGEKISCFILPKGHVIRSPGAKV